MSISAVITVRDGELYLAEAIDSVLGEPEIDEVVVVDDGSIDGTQAVLNGYGAQVRVLRQSPAGHAAALNHGISAARGDLIAVLDADDIWTKGRTAALLSVLDRDLDGVFGWVEQFVSPDLDPVEAGRLRVDQVPQAAYLLNSLLVRRTAFDRVGPLAEDLVTSANIDWISRARAARLRTVVVPTVVTRRRVHASNLGRRAAATRNADLLRVIRSHVERRRKDGP